jgi:ParB-like chromosome segregation protein Spo0J
MQIKLRPLADVHPYPGNPRLNDDAVDAVAESIRRFGFRQPIVVDAEGVVVAGHTRLKAAQKLGLEKVPVHVARDLSPEEVRAYRLADNATSERAEWDYELLPIELEAIGQAGFDAESLGFDPDSLAKLLAPEAFPGDATVSDPGRLELRRGRGGGRAAPVRYLPTRCPTSREISNKRRRPSTRSSR